MGTATQTSPTGRRILAVVAWLGAILLGGWLAGCALFQFAGIATEAEIISTRTEQHRTRRGHPYSNTYGVVRYADQTGRTHTDEVQLYGNANVGRKIAVRYLPARPDVCLRDNYWGIWGFAVMASGIFALAVGLTWYVERKRRPVAPPRNPFDQTTP